MTPSQLVRTFQLVDSFFPVGAFAYSDGLESAAAAGLLRDGRDLGIWLEHYVDRVFEPCEGLALVQCLRAVTREDWSAIRVIDEELSALKPSESVRASSRAIGKRLIAAYGALLKSPERARFVPMAAALSEANAAAAYGVVFAHGGVDVEAAVLAFGYARLAGMVSASLRTIALGQSEGQALLSTALDRLCEAVERMLRSDPLRPQPLRSFAPMLDIQQMNHRYVYSRLFRS